MTHHFNKWVANVVLLGCKEHMRIPCPKSAVVAVQIFPRNATETPALLASIERNIAAATYDANSMAVPLQRRAAPTALPPGQAGSVPPTDATRAAFSSNSAFHIYSTALEEFTAGFPTYRPLMLEIKGELDGAVNDAVRCAKENVELRQKRTEARRAREAAVDEAYKKVLPCPSLRRRHHASLWCSVWLCEYVELLACTQCSVCWLGVVITDGCCRTLSRQFCDMARRDLHTHSRAPLPSRQTTAECNRQIGQFAGSWSSYGGKVVAKRSACVAEH